MHATRKAFAFAFAVWVATLLLAVGIGCDTRSSEAARREDVPSSLRDALAESDPIERIGRTTRLLERLDPESLPEVMAVYDDMLPLMDPWEIRAVMVAWARFDPSGALDHGLGWPPNEHRALAAGAALEGWARLDPRAARSAFDRIAASERRLGAELARGLVSGWVHSGDLEELGAFLANLRPAVRDEAIDALLRELIRSRGANAALSFADSILREEAHVKRFKRSLLRRATRLVARSQPERAAAWALKYATAEYAVDAPGVLAEVWGSQDGAAALAWLRGHPATQLQASAVREAFLAWAGANPRAAEAWLESESLTEFHDPALEAWATRQISRQPPAALAWCERIADSERQQACLLSNARSWYGRDAVAAEAWLQQSSLDESIRREVRIPPRLQKRPRRGAR